MSPWGIYALALSVTVVVETGLACLLRRDKVRRLLVDVPLMNLFTHPLLHLAMGQGLHVVPGELMVMAVESLLYRRVTGLSWAWSLGLGIGLNAVTWSLGPLFAHLVA